MKRNKTKRTQGLRRFFLGTLLVAIAASLSLYYVNSYLHAPMAIVEMQTLNVSKGRTYKQVLSELSARGLLQHQRLLEMYSRLAGRGDRIHAGEYLLGPGTTPSDLLNMLEQGQVRTHSIALIEGRTIEQMRDVMRNSVQLAKVVADVPSEKLLNALGIDPEPGRPPEGLFFPDTYVFSGATSDRDILRQAYLRMHEVLEEEWKGRAEGLPYRNSYEALIMASIVERETGLASERPAIAGVFVRRLQRGMLLQTDPTVIYGLRETFDGNLRRRDLHDADNPFNTYQRPGLTPTPIALPGRAAIHAALHPASGASLFFVARGDGSHQFSETLDEHQKAVRKYQIQQRRADYRSRPQP